MNTTPLSPIRSGCRWLVALCAGLVSVCGSGEALAATATNWTYCAGENQRCDFSGSRDVRYGTDSSYVVFGMTNGAVCSNQVFGDPAPNAAKGCSYATDASKTLGQTGWQTTWGRSMLPQGTAVLNNVTLRSPVRTSLGGRQLKVRLSNLYGSTPLNVAEVHAALRNTQSTDLSAIVTSTDTVITFNGQRAVSVAAGTEVVSDAAVMTVPPLTDVMITMFYASTNLNDSHTTNVGGLVTQAINNNGNAINAVSAASLQGVSGYTTYPGWYGLSGVEVGNPVPVGTAFLSFLALGDSITDGALITSPYKDWPSMFAAKMGGAFAVVNGGIGSNQLLTDGTGLAGLTRFNREGLDRPDVVNASYVILLEGINDIQISNRSATDIIAGYQKLIASAHAKSVGVFIATLPPWSGWSGFTAAREAQRQQLNNWIRTNGTFEGVIDFEGALIETGSSPSKMKASCYADGIHPNENGYKIMAAVAANTLLGTPASAAELRCQ